VKTFDRFLKIIDKTGVDRNIFADHQIPHVMASGHHILSQRQVPGVECNAHETADGIVADIVIRRDTRLLRPFHLCFGMLPESGTQHIKMSLRLEENAAVNVVSHCIFPNARQVMHTMDARIDVGAGARLTYSDSHHHGSVGGITVIPKVVVNIAEGGLYRSDFSLTKGRVGTLDIDYDVTVADAGVAEMSSRIFGHETDQIRIRERVVLAGEAARGLIKTRVAIENDAQAEIIGITEGNAAHVRGHMDCMEIVKDNARASAQPIVRVSHPLAKVTHEAAIGSVDHQQLETLMAHGLSPEQAVDLIVSGLLGSP
jgi:Fe-S cluster assembly scaffold protein SufB